MGEGVRQGQLVFLKAKSSPKQEENLDGSIRLGQDLLLTVTQTLEQTNLHSHRHKLSVLIHARKHAKPTLPFDSFSRAAPRGRASRGSPGPSPRLGFSAAGWQSSVREEVLGITGGREGWRQRTAHGRGRDGFTVQGKGCWQPRGQRGGAGRVVRRPHTKSRGVGAIVPGTSLCGEAGRRSTSPEETL